MTFCTAIKCIDGRSHVPVISFLTQRFNCDHVDIISEPGPNLILAENQDRSTVESILQRVNISIEKHRSKGIAVSAHADCAGNPNEEKKQRLHTIAAVRYIRSLYPSLPIIGLWVNGNGIVSELEID